MTKVEREVFIAATSEEIEVFALDPDRLDEWWVGLESVESDGVWPEPGGVAKLALKVAGVTGHIDVIAEELVWGDHFFERLEGTINGTLKSWHFEEMSGTRIRTVMEYEVSGGILGKIADKLVMEHAIAEQLTESLELLAQLSEAEHEAHLHA